jgi:hypothetical protein
LAAIYLVTLIAVALATIPLIIVTRWVREAQSACFEWVARGI